jgi:NAD(P)-dependent dehydrogenase (short-subunit alcohol dehydrogenase family)
VSRILITGTNSGFGLLTTLALARAGHDVVATMRTPTKGDALREVVEAEALPVEIRTLDVCDPASITAAVGDPAELDVVINNAGFEVAGAIELVDDALLARQFDTNVFGPVRLARAVLPTWRRRGSGTIVNVSSIAGVIGTPFGGVYAASKHALEALSEALHFETSIYGIRVRLIEPGRFATGFHDNIVTVDGWDGSEYAARAERFREAQGALQGDGPPADPQDVVAAIVAAATDPSAPFRRFVGNDALLVSAAKASMSFEDFEAAMRATLNWFD